MRLRWRRWAAGFVKRPSKVVYPGSTLGDFLQHFEELRIRDARAVGAVNDACSLRPQGRDAESHGDAVISGGINLCAVKLLPAGDAQAIRMFFNLGSHGAQIFRDRGDSV